MAKRDRRLGVWLYDERIAELKTTGQPYNLSLQYTDAARTRWPLNTPLLSCSLPLGSRWVDARNYFRGLLPEGQQLQQLAATANVTVTDLFGLVSRYGRDVAGAVTLMPGDEEPEDRPGGLVAYDFESLATEVAGLDERPLAIYDDSELSLPGLQNKLLLVREDGRWFRPTGGRPSTHILKVEDRRYPGLVTMEAAAMRLANRVGLTSVSVDVVSFDGVDCIIVERFDREERATGKLERVHQEDVCQALDWNFDAQRGRAKYEAHGGPSLKAAANLLDMHCDDPRQQLKRLVAAVTFSTVIGNADAHAKNLSVLHTSPGRIELAPLYDLVPTALWDKLPDRAAMHINSQRKLSLVRMDDIVSEAAGWNLDRTEAEQTVRNTVGAMLENLNELPEEFARLVDLRARKLLTV